MNITAARCLVILVPSRLDHPCLLFAVVLQYLSEAAENITSNGSTHAGANWPEQFIVDLMKSF
jgi:hypothetical protein